MISLHYKIQSDGSVGSEMLGRAITTLNNKGQDKGQGMPTASHIKTSV